jgi:hypothetical protein
VDDPSNAVSFVIVGASTDDEGTLAARHEDRAQRADVALEGGLAESGDLCGLDGRGGFSEAVGGLAPATAEGESYVVLVDAGSLGYLRRREACDLERIRPRIVERMG